MQRRKVAQRILSLDNFADLASLREIKMPKLAD
jgi:hypothetical protein